MIFDEVKMANTAFGFSQCSLERNKYGTCCDNTTLISYYKLEDEIMRNNTQLGMIAANQLADRIKNNINLLAETKTFLMNQVKIMNITNVDCWQFVRKVRASSICFTCSGRSENFFANKTKVLVDSQTCIAGVQSCVGFHQRYVFIKKLFAFVAEIFSMVTSENPDVSEFTIL